MGPSGQVVKAFSVSAEEADTKHESWLGDNLGGGGEIARVCVTAVCVHTRAQCVCGVCTCMCVPVAVWCVCERQRQNETEREI